MVGGRVNRYRRQIAVLLLIFCAVHLFSLSAFGTDSDDVEVHEIILLFDLSTSMGWNDTAFLAPDALIQIVSSLPSHWSLGLVTFNADVVDVVPPALDTREVIQEILEGTRYTNFTNSGAGLQQATELFSDDARSRTIIFVTDGEMAVLPTEDATTDALYFAEQVITQIIASDIQVHTIAVGVEYEGVHESIMGLAHATGGYLFQDVPSEALSGAASELVFDVLGTAGIHVGTSQTNGYAGHFVVHLPAVGLDSATVLITTESAVEHIVVSGSGDRIETQTGQRFALVEIVRPADQTVHIQFIAPGESNAILRTEWNLRLMAEVGYGDTTRFWIADGAGENVFLNPFFNRNFFPISGNEADAKIYARHGYLYWDVEVEEAFSILRTQAEMFGINSLRSFEVLERVPSPSTGDGGEPGEMLPEASGNALSVEQTGRGSIVWIVALIGFVLAIALFILLRYAHSKQATYISAGQKTESRFTFTGKLDLYVATGSNGTDTPPQTVQMSRPGKKREMSLQTILQKCRLSNRFPDMDPIYFATDGQGSLQIRNDSNRIVYIGSDALAEKQTHTLGYGERVRVYGEAEASELVISPRFLYRAGERDESE